MHYVILISMGLLLTVSVFLHSLQEDKKKKELYSEITPYFKQSKLFKENPFYPSFEGIYGNLRIKIIPKVDALTFRSLPAFYIRIYILMENKYLFRIVKNNEREYICPLVRFENCNMMMIEKNPDLKLFLPDKTQKNNLDCSGIVKSFCIIEDCCEVIMKENLIRATILLGRGKKIYFVLFRAAEFPKMVLKSEYFRKVINYLLQLRKEVSKIEGEI